MKPIIAPIRMLQQGLKWIKVPDKKPFQNAHSLPLSMSHATQQQQQQQIKQGDVSLSLYSGALVLKRLGHKIGLISLFTNAKNEIAMNTMKYHFLPSHVSRKILTVISYCSERRMILGKALILL